MSFQTLRCVLCTSESVRRKVWCWTEKYTLLVNELLDLVANNEKFSQWQAQGSISRKEIEKLLKPLKGSAPFKDLPSRFYTSAVLMVQYTYLSWLALQKRRSSKIKGKQRWLEVLETDLELASITGFDWETIRGRASELLDQTSDFCATESKESVAQPGKTEHNNAEHKINQQTLLNALFSRFSHEKDPLNLRAIAYLIRNSLEIEEQEETLDELLFRFERKRIEIERLGKQLESSKPKGRDPLGSRFQQSINLATALPQPTSTNAEADFNIWKSQKQIQSLNTLHYPVLFGSITDLFWSFESEVKHQNQSENVAKKRRGKKRQEKSLDRICVNFNGFKKFLGETPAIFKVQCDRRQLPVLRQIVTDWHAYKELPEEEQYGLGLMVLKSAQLMWKKDQQQLHKKKLKKQAKEMKETMPEQSPEPWQTHRLYLHICIDPDLLTAEGTAAVQKKKMDTTVKKLDGLKRKLDDTTNLARSGENTEKVDVTEEAQRNLEARIAANTTSLNRLQRSAPQRPSKPPYQGQPNIVVGVSFGREQPVGVAVVDLHTKAIVEYQNIRVLLSNRAVKLRRGNRSIVQLRLEKYRLVNRRHRQQQKNSIRRTKEQRQNRYAQSKREANLGEYIDRLIASRIVKLAAKWKASSIVVPDLSDIRESIEAALRAKAELKYPNEFERQRRYVKHTCRNFHTWSYNRLTQCIQNCASKIGIPIEQGQQPAQGNLQDKAVQVVLYAYYTRESQEK